MRITNIVGLTGVVFTGGQSTRFGTDKSAFVIGTSSMAERTVATVSSVISNVIISGAPGNTSPTNVRYVEDTIVNGGPLAGLAAAFGATESDWLFVLACDMQNVSGPSIQKLLALRTRDSLAIVPRERSGRLHPLFACYHRATSDYCTRMLSQGVRSMKRYVQSISDQGLVLFPTVDDRTLLNVNHPSDLAGVSPASELGISG